MAETWKTVSGYDGMYEVSDHGRVRSWKRHGGCPGRREEPRILKAALDGAGYPFVVLYKEGRRNPTCVHALVLIAFIGPRPDGKECCHGDGDPTKNHLSNLRWDTKSANAKDAVAHGTSSRGEAHGNAKLAVTDITEIRKLFAIGGITQTALGVRFGVSRSNISFIIRRERWAHVGA